MQCKMIVSRALFDFDFTNQKDLQLRSVHFLDDEMTDEKNQVLTVKENDKIDFFVNGRVLVSRFSREQVLFAAAASKYFGHLPVKDKIPVWLWSGSLEMETGLNALNVEEPVCC